MAPKNCAIGYSVGMASPFSFPYQMCEWNIIFQMLSRFQNSFRILRSRLYRSHHNIMHVTALLCDIFVLFGLNVENDHFFHHLSAINHFLESSCFCVFVHFCSTWDFLAFPVKHCDITYFILLLYLMAFSLFLATMYYVFFWIFVDCHIPHW